MVLGHLIPTGGSGVLTDDTEDVDGGVAGNLAEDHGVIAVEIHGVVLLVDGAEPDVGHSGELVPHRGFEIDTVGVLLVEDVDEDITGLDGAGEVDLLVLLGGSGTVGVTLQAVVRHVDGGSGRVVDFDGFVVGPSLDVLGDEKLGALGRSGDRDEGRSGQEEQLAHGVGLK